MWKQINPFIVLFIFCFNTNLGPADPGEIWGWIEKLSVSLPAVADRADAHQYFLNLFSDYNTRYQFIFSALLLQGRKGEIIKI